MPNETPRPWYAVPQHRIIDAAPVAFSITLLCIFYTMPLGIVLLNLWLWLKYPRNLSRYATVAAVIALYITLTVGSEYVVGNLSGYLRYHNPSRVMYLFSFAAVVMIAYRFVSRCEFKFQKNDSVAKSKGTRGSIADLIWLSLFSAILFVCLREDIGGRSGWRDPNLSVLAASFACITAMRLFSRERLTLFSIISTAAIAFSIAWLFEMFLLRDGVRQYDGTLDWSKLAPWQRYGFGKRHTVVLIESGIAVAFAMMMRRSGIRLSNERTQREYPRLKKWTLRLTKLALFFVILGAMGMLCFSPLKVSANGHIGWPLYASSVTADWKFFPTGITINLLLCFAVALSITTPKFAYRWVSRRKIILFRIATACIFLGLVVNTVVLRPIRHNKRAQNEFVTTTGTTIEYDSLVERLVAWAERKFDVPWADARARPERIVISNASREQVKDILSMRNFYELNFRGCDLTKSAIESLRNESLYDLTISDCETDQTTIAAISQTAQLLQVNLDQDVALKLGEMPLANQATLRMNVRVTNPNAMFKLPRSVKRLGLAMVCPDACDVVVNGRNELEFVDIRENDSGEIQHLKLRVSESVNLNGIAVDDRIVVNLTIDDATNLGQMSINGFHVSAVDIKNVQVLDFLNMNVAECKDFRIQGASSTDVVLSGFDAASSSSDSGDSFFDQWQLSGVEYLSLDGFVFGTEGLERMLRKVDPTSLRLSNCRGFAESIDRIKAPLSSTLSGLMIDDSVSLHDTQLTRLMVLFPNLDTLEIDGSQLTTLSAQWPTTLNTIEIRNADRLKTIPASLIQTVSTLHTLELSKRKEFGFVDGYLSPLYRQTYPTGFGNGSKPSPAITVHGSAADEQTIAAIAKKVKAGWLGTDLVIISPTASKKAFLGIDWGNTNRLTVADAPVDDQVVASWKLDNVFYLDLRNTRVSVAILPAIAKALDYGVINLQGNDLGLIPDLSKVELESLILKGCNINRQQFRALQRSEISKIDLTDCKADFDIDQAILESFGEPTFVH